MNTQTLMTAASLILAAAGVSALFVPDVILSLANTSATAQLSALVQLMGALYFGFAIMNWTARDSAIGGIYARPVSLGNFGHFFAGGLLLLRYQLSNPFSLFILIVSILYAIFAILFYWLVFRATGINNLGSRK
jgi:hypothetical protein